MKILLLGSGGQVGTHLADALSSRHELVSLSRSDLDIADEDALRTALEQYQYDFLINAEASFPVTGITALFGKSGCGKSTLLRLIAGLETQYSGELILDGKVLEDEHGQTPPWQRNLGYISQESSLFPHMSVLSNLKYASNRKQNSEHGWSAEQLIEHFGLTELLHKYPAQLSGLVDCTNI